MEIKNVTVAGGGTMGNGIAHVFALKGYNVNLLEATPELAEKAVATISANLDRQLKKGSISEQEKSDTLSRINKVAGVENVPPDTDLVIEAIYENKEAKLKLFNILNGVIKPESIFASNTSSISITELSALSRPDKFIGMHFMNPVPVMKLVEVIRGYSTSDETYNAIKILAEKIRYG